MHVADLCQTIDFEAAGDEMYALVAELYPLCRSITGDGVRRTLARLARDIALVHHEVPSGTRVFDWTVPPEWNIDDAWVKNAKGERVIESTAMTLKFPARICGTRLPMPSVPTCTELVSRAVATSPPLL